MDKPDDLQAPAPEPGPAFQKPSVLMEHAFQLIAMSPETLKAWCQDMPAEHQHRLARERQYRFRTEQQHLSSQGSSTAYPEPKGNAGDP